MQGGAFVKQIKTFDPILSLRPIWAGDTMFHESVMYLENETEARLLYKPEEVLSVLSYDYKTEYVRGVDWDVQGDRLVRLPDSRMPAFPLAEYYPAQHQDGHDFGCTVEGHAYLAYGETDTFQKYQVSVTYRHEDAWQGRIPTARGEQFARFFSKLARGEEATIVFYGDSITTGMNSTATFRHAPFTPSFAYMVTKTIADKYGYRISLDADPYIPPIETPLSGDHVLHYVNTAVAGMDSIWGYENAHDRAGAYHPDLFVLGFGMNDPEKPPEQFIRIIGDTVDQVRQDAPEADVCLIATMLPHWRAKGFCGYQKEFEPAMEAYAAGQSRMAVAPMTSVHAELLRKKEFYTMTGNNINHCNDFLARVYAMTIIATLGL